MKKKVLQIFLCISMFLLSMPQLQAQTNAYIVMAQEDGRILEGEHLHEQQSVASISKIMTAVIALEYGNVEDVFEVGDEIASAVGSSIYLKKGQEVTLKSLLYGLMLRSGNDAANAIAVHIANTQEEFVALMNEKAKQIGMEHTLFENASGLDEEGEGNVSTVYDMALLMQYALRLPMFNEINSTQYYTSEWSHRWKNKNRLLFEYEYTTGGKTGFTKKAGRTLVTSAKQNNLETIVVTFRYGDDFAFHKQKHEEAVKTYESMLLTEQGMYTILGKQYEIERPMYMTLKPEEEVQVSTHIEENEWIIEARYGDVTHVKETKGE